MARIRSADGWSAAGSAWRSTRRRIASASGRAMSPKDGVSPSPRYSETPPEKVIASGGRALRSGGRRSKASVSALTAALESASKRRSAMCSTMRASASGRGLTPTSSAMPASCAKRRPASSTRATWPRASNETIRAPMSIAVISNTSPASHTAIFEVPPPMSTFMTRASSRIDRATAPEPNAARVVARAGRSTARFVCRYPAIASLYNASASLKRFCTT